MPEKHVMMNYRVIHDELGNGAPGPSLDSFIEQANRLKAARDLVEGRYGGVMSCRVDVGVNKFLKETLCVYNVCLAEVQFNLRPQTQTQAQAKHAPTDNDLCLALRDFMESAGVPFWVQKGSDFDLALVVLKEFGKTLEAAGWFGSYTGRVIHFKP